MTNEPTGAEIVETLLWVMHFANESLTSEIKLSKGKEKRWAKDQRRAVQEIMQKLLAVDTSSKVISLDLDVDDWQVISVPLVGMCNAREKMKADGAPIPEQLSAERLGVLVHAMKAIADWDRGYINPPVMPTMRA